jgi:hypothetical protein
MLAGCGGSQPTIARRAQHMSGKQRVSRQSDLGG